MGLSTPVPDRTKALAELVEAYRDTPFAWGVHDCCMWAARVVQAQRGDDPAAQWRGTYRTAREARALIEREFGSMEQIPAKLGFEEVPVLSCQRGWLAAAKFPRRGVALGVCLGTKAAFAGRFGLLFVPMSEVTRAWKI